MCCQTQLPVLLLLKHRTILGLTHNMKAKASVLKPGCFCQSCKTLDLNTEHSPLDYSSDKDHIEQQGRSSPTVESSQVKRQQFFSGTALCPHLLAKSSSTLLRKQP